MNTLFIGKNFVALPETGSTNTFASELLSAQPPEGTVIFTTNQTEGRGMQGNRWYGEPGANIACSLILYPRFLASGKVFLLNKMLSCALYDTLTHFLPEAEVCIKWPNDMLAGRRKVAGLLLENQLEKGAVAVSVIGIGLNVNQTEFPEAEYGKAGSMALAAGRTFDVREVLDVMLENVEAQYLALRSGRTGRMERDYLRRLFGYQEHIDLVLRGERRNSYIVGVDRHGRLAVEEDRKLAYYGVREVEFCL